MHFKHKEAHYKHMLSTIRLLLSTTKHTLSTHMLRHTRARMRVHAFCLSSAQMGNVEQNPIKMHVQKLQIYTRRKVRRERKGEKSARASKTGSDTDRQTDT